MKTLWPGKWKIDKGIEKEKREREREMDFVTRLKFQLGPLLPWDDRKKSANEVEKVKLY